MVCKNFLQVGERLGQLRSDIRARRLLLAKQTEAALQQQGEEVAARREQFHRERGEIGTVYIDTRTRQYQSPVYSTVLHSCISMCDAAPRGAVL